MPMAERVASALGALIVLGTIGFLTVETFRRGDQEPALTVSVVQIREAPEGFVVSVEVRNRSRGAAADVQLAGIERGSDTGRLQPVARLDYVPGFSSRRTNLVFAVDPGSAPQVRILGYTRP